MHIQRYYDAFLLFRLYICNGTCHPIWTHFDRLQLLGLNFGLRCNTLHVILLVEKRTIASTNSNYFRIEWGPVSQQNIEAQKIRKTRFHFLPARYSLCIVISPQYESQCKKVHGTQATVNVLQETRITQNKWWLNDKERKGKREKERASEKEWGEKKEYWAAAIVVSSMRRSIYVGCCCRLFFVCTFTTKERHTPEKKAQTIFI